MTSSSSYIPDHIPEEMKGTGAFGNVFESYDRNHNVRFAVKRTHKAGSKLSREYEILTQLKECEYIVKLIDVYFIESCGKLSQNLVFEYVPLNLSKYMKDFKKKKKHITIKKIKKIARQLLLGLDYCHKKNIVHRDLKPENILLTNDEQVKICDFGSSKVINNNNTKFNELADLYYGKTKSTPFTVSLYYRAPELIFSKCDYDSKIDIFSIGLIIGELFSLSTLFAGVDEGMQLFEYINVLGPPDPDYLNEFDIPKAFKEYLKNYKISKFYTLQEILNKDNYYKKKDIDEIADLLNHMLQWDYRERYSAEQCLKHKFFTNSDE